MKRIQLAGMVLLSVFLITACGKKDSDPAAEQNNPDTAFMPEMDLQENDPSEQDTKEQFTEENKMEDKDNESVPLNEKREVRIYYIDDETGEPASDETDIIDENDIWSALQEKGILDDDCRLLNFYVDQEKGRIDLDFNAALGDRIRSFGTTGETEILGCLVNTYLDAYDCDGICLTEEGAPLETSSGANYDGYSGKIEF